MKIITKVLSVALAVIMLATLPAKVLAALDNAKYVSEVVTVAAKDTKEAKSKLEAAGYKMVEGNLNATLKTGVYLGYKETDNKKEAITDIAAMNMLGKFSYSDYKEIMEAYKENIETEVMNIETSIEEFQMGYANEKKNALMAYSALNMFKDDDSGKLMGDYFLDYDFSDASNKSVTDTLMQANSDIVVTMIKALTFAGDADDTTVIDRMAKTGPNGIEQRYSKIYQTTAQANRAMSKEYGSVADKLYDGWDTLYDYLKTAEETIVKKDAKGNIDIRNDAFAAEEKEPLKTEGMPENVKEFVEAMDALSDLPDDLETMTEFSLYALLNDTKFGGGTLLDFFMRPASEVDRTELYVLVDSMTEAQRGQAVFVNIKDILLGAFSDSEDTSTAQSEAVDEYTEFTEKIEPVSIFDGIDRSVFTDGVAFTSDAVTHEALTGQSWFDKLKDVTTGDSSYWNTKTIACWAAAAGLTAMGIASSFIWKALLTKAEPAFDRMYDALGTVHYRFHEIGIGISDNPNEALAYLKERAAKNTDDAMWKENVDLLDDVVAEVEMHKDRIMYAVIGTLVSFIWLFVVLLYDICTLVQFLVADDPTEESIPHHIMATADTPYGEDYVYYQTVKTLDGEAADVNNHEADAKTGWLVLYSTKDANAGYPISAGNINIVTGNTNFDEDASFVHLFNEVGALNTTSASYTGVNDAVGGTYILFERGVSAFAGSAISGGSVAIIAGCGLVLGGVLGSIITALVKKKKSEAI